jgi:hypothetical protein
MPQTFDIRFARSAGLAAILEEPSNRFRLKGAGLLSIAADGVTFAARRSLLSVFTHARSRRIAAANLREVYREGDALRIEFATPESPREVMPFWVDDRRTGSEIVRLMPTSRTVELDDAPKGSASPPASLDRRLLLSLALLIVLCAGAAYLLTRASAPMVAIPARIADPPPLAIDLKVEPVEATPSATAPASETFLEPLPIELKAPVIPAPRPTWILAIPRGTPAYEVGRRELDRFEREAAALLTEYRTHQANLESGALAAEPFADILQSSLAMRWWNLTFAMLASDELADPKLLDLRATMLAAARHWRNFLEGYATGIRERDHVKIARSFDELAQAEELQSRARLYLR